MRGFIAVTLLLASIAAAHAFGLGMEGRNFGRLGAIFNKKAAAGGSIVGGLMLEDGTSFLLLEDASSHFCLEGGC